MTTGMPGDLLAVLAGTRHLLLDFDGRVCDIFAGLPAADVAARLRELAGASGAELPAEVAATADPLRVFAWAAGADRRLGVRVEAEMTELECAAASAA